MKKPLLEVKGLKTHFPVEGGTVFAVDGVSLSLDEGEILGIVGESGCGKSVTALSLMRLVDEPARIVGGMALFRDGEAIKDLLALPRDELQEIRGHKISIIFQDPMTSLNPVLTIGYHLSEPLKHHERLSAKAARARVIDLLQRVGIPDASQRLQDYPHQFSGGMRQRVMIAMAMACRPKLIIADEPTTALDVTIQAQILDLLRQLRDDYGASIIIITHDLGVVAEIADKVVVMYAGRVVEGGSVRAIFRHSRHPYTRALLASVPRLTNWPDRLPTIEGTPPDLRDEIESCPFEPRCSYRIPACLESMPPLLAVAPGHQTACFVAHAGGLDGD
ncbi:MAG: ABC transporter ATP-binding protein [Thermomicrobiales bacterium]